MNEAILAHAASVANGPQWAAGVQAYHAGIVRLAAILRMGLGQCQQAVKIWTAHDGGQPLECLKWLTRRAAQGLPMPWEGL